MVYIPKVLYNYMMIYLLFYALFIIIFTFILLFFIILFSDLNTYTKKISFIQNVLKL